MLMNGRKRDVTSPELSNFSLKKFRFDVYQLTLQIWDTSIRFRLSFNSFKPCSIRRKHGLVWFPFLIRVFTKILFDLLLNLRWKIFFFQDFQDNIRKLQSTQEKAPCPNFSSEALSRSFVGNNCKKIVMFSTQPLCCYHWSFGQQLQ